MNEYAWSMACPESSRARSMREALARIQAMDLSRNVSYRAVVRYNADTGEVLDLRVKRKRYGKRVHRARRKAERALALTCVATGGAHTPAPTRAVCEACGISKLRVVRGGGQL